MEPTEPRMEEARRQRCGVCPDEELELVIQRVAELGAARQLSLLRAVMPGVLVELADEERGPFVRSLEIG